MSYEVYYECVTCSYGTDSPMRAKWHEGVTRHVVVEHFEGEGYQGDYGR